MAAQNITDPPPYFSKHKPGLMLGTAWRATHLTILHICNHQTLAFMIITPSLLTF